MAQASFAQTSFLGGEFSPYMQGRWDRQDYRTAMNVCYNALPIEEGSWIRRSGTRWLQFTRDGSPTVLKSFFFSSAQPYTISFTDGHMRFFSNLGLVTDAGDKVVVAIDDATPAEVTVAEAHGWDTGDQVKFRLDPGLDDVGIHRLLNRQFEITVIDDYKFTLTDTIQGGEVVGTNLDLGMSGLFAQRITDIETFYSADRLAAVRTVQDGASLMVLHPDIQPWTLRRTSEPATDLPAVFEWGPQGLKDGPYFDPFRDGSTVTPSGVGPGMITLTAAIGAGPDPAFPGFVSTDLGRLIRLFSEPLAWDAGEAYAVGDKVAFDGAYYSALTASTGDQPDLILASWTPDATAAAWTWGSIQEVTDATHVEVNIEPLVTGEDNVASGPLLYTHAIEVWRLGLFCETTGYPTNGTYHEGRTVLAGAQSNRLDGSVSNDSYNFAPTGRDGTVADNSAFSYTFNAALQNNILWMLSDTQGILCGTRDAEWVVRASSINDPLTPTSIQAKPTTFYGSGDIAPIRTGLAACFVHKHRKKLLEYLRTPQPGEFAATNLSLTAKHLSEPKIAEIAYQAELAPVIWARLDDGGLIGCSYKRDDPYGTQPVQFSGWHKHVLGNGRLVTSLQSGPAPDGEIDTITIATSEADGTGPYFVEALVNLNEPSQGLLTSFFVDSGTPPVLASFNGTSTLSLYGFRHLLGTEVSVMLGGIDMGDFEVAAGGIVNIPNALTVNPLLTPAFLQALTDSGEDYGSLGIRLKYSAAGDGPDPDFATITRLLDSTGLVQGIFYWGSTVDWENGHLYASNGGSGDDTTNGLYKFDLLTGAMLDEGNDAARGGVNFRVNSGAPMLHYKGFLYYTQGNSNTVRVVKLADTDLGTVVSYFGTAGSGGHTDAGGLTHPYTMTGVSTGNADYLVSGGLFADLNVLGLTPDIHFITTFDLGTLKVTTCAGPAYPGHATAYAFRHLTALETAADCELYILSIRDTGIVGDTPVVDYVYIGTVLKTDVDPSWTEWECNGIWRDASTGDLFTQASDGSDVYLLCLDPETAAIKWKTLISTTNAFNNWYWAADEQVFSNGRGVVFDNGGPNASVAKQIDLSDGSIIDTITLEGCIITTATYDAATGRVIYYGDYNSAISGAPTGATTASNKWWSFGPGGDVTPGTTFYAPNVVGYTFVSRGQILRAIQQQEAGTYNGPALGKLRRNHQYAMLLTNTQGLSVGTRFTDIVPNLRPAQFKQPDGTDYALTELYSGIIQATIEDDSSYDGMVAWEISRPYPATVLAVEPFLQGQDR